MLIGKIITSLCARGFLFWLKDSDYIKLYYFGVFNKRLNLQNPETFNEKLQWLKLYDRKDIYTKMVDKFEAKKYVADIIGNSHIIPTLNVWNSFDEIDFKELPESFVLKTTHDSGGVFICKNKSAFNARAARIILSRSLKTNFYMIGREWPYKNVKPRIIAEPYMHDGINDDLVDYKIHCFNGVPKIVLVCKDRSKKRQMTEDFFDINWNHLNVKRPKKNNSKEQIVIPNNYEQMINFSRKISAGIPFVRVDFYVINNVVYFGEITFFPASGFEKFIPDEFDLKMGNWIHI